VLLAEDYDQFITSFVIGNYASKIGDILNKIFTELNFPENLIKDCNIQKNKRQRKSSAKKQLKPVTEPAQSSIKKTPSK